MKNIKFEGIIPAFLTPLCEDNKTVNVQEAKKLLDLQLEQGADGFYILGGTGEGLLMGREQREILCEAAVEHVAKRKPVINHIASLNFHEAIELAKHAEKAGVDAISAVPPSIFAYNDDEIFAYYKRLAEAVSIPLIIYYQPACQKNMSAKLIARIFEIDNVTGVKWSDPNFFEMMKLKDMTGGEMNIINGPDELLISGLAAGADAGIGTTYNVMVPAYKKIYEYFKKGELDKAREMQFKVNKVIALLIRYNLMTAVKETTSLLGIEVGDAQFPRQPRDPQRMAEYRKELLATGWPFC